MVSSAANDDNAASFEGIRFKSGRQGERAMQSRRRACAIVAIAALASAGVAVAANPKVIKTEPQKVGNGMAYAYVSLDAKGTPLALGVSLDEAALEGLPSQPNATSRCFDKNGNGKMDADECIGDYNFTFVIPEGEASKAAAPFKWIALNWNPHGHGHPAPPPWAAPHFDFHFYIASRDSVKLLRAGSCGEMIDCDDFKKATKPVPARYIHADHINVGAAVPDMGNHLINSKAPELAKGGPPFTHTFIYGAYDGQITFLEPMITRAYIVSKPNMCESIKQPQAWEVAGFYPTKYCVRYVPASHRYTVSIESFVRRSVQ
jgi:hypothetical protein